ncbi:MAG: hypothetical protein BalsKO_13370 [Balneolaceae bacterium]
MKKHRGKPTVPITDPKIDQYSEEYTTPESEGIKNLIISSDQELEYIDMLSGRVVGQLLKLLVKNLKSKENTGNRHIYRLFSYYDGRGFA